MREAVAKMVFSINSEFPATACEEIIMMARTNDHLGATEFPDMAADGPIAVYSGAARTLWQVLETTTEAFPGATALDDGQSVLR